MSNSIALAEQYLPILDELYKKESLTNILDAGPNRIKFKGGNKIELFKTTIDGLGNYSRNNGFVSGSITGEWEDLTLTKDRGRSFMVDSMDDEETLGMAFGTLVGEFMRTRVIPEVDAYRFATMAGASNIDGATADITYGTTDVVALLDAAEESMGDNEVPKEGRILYVSELCYKALKGDISRTIANENGVNRQIEIYDGMIVRRVPKSRFCTGITLYDGTTSGQTDGGYKFTASTSKPINFMIVAPSAVVSAVKHEVPRIFAPNVNQQADAWKFDYRIYHDIFVEENKVKGIYVHKASTGLAADIVG